MHMQRTQMTITNKTTSRREESRIHIREIGHRPLESIEGEQWGKVGGADVQKKN